ncbi:MAG: hypothetical protein WBP61_11435 [Nocardioides sp.]
MNIDVRPTPALRRHRARIVGAVAGVAMLAVTGFAVAELADASTQGIHEVPASDSRHP